ncbi:LAMI_0B01728g1_1 [Lachancea mirantina]|uniref:LAMI_0B01728g1_1 n=1 Tax=Lachancea mirantina TaxID=1230905 RepID=A0A1G4ITL6_9SACH|nr:LAMI_0B01728g1_1 [Lachancea mirantina]
MSQRDVLIVGISGCSSSGKTTIAKLIAELLPGATLIHEDDFFKHDDEIPLNKKFGVKDWDCPEALDLDLFGQELDHIKATGKISAKLVHNNNVDDVSRFCVSKETKETLRKEFNAFEAASDVHVVVVDGFMMFHDPKIACKFDRKLLIRAPYASLKSRRAARSGYQTLDSFWIDPPFYFDEFVYKSYAKNHASLFEENDVEGRIRKNSGVQDYVNDDGMDINDALLWACHQIVSPLPSFSS